MRVRSAEELLRNAAVLALVLLLPRDLWACSCVGPRGKQALDGAVAAFTGKAVRVDYLDADEPKREPRIVVTFEVDRWWKGPRTKSAVLHTIYNKWTCDGYHFARGEEYLVIAYRNPEEIADRFPRAKNTIGVNICGATRPLASAKEDLDELGPGHGPR